MNDLVLEIQQLRSRLDALRPLPTHTLASLREQMALEWTYHSNAIEGNTLTLLETKVVLEGITVEGKSIQEHLEAINHRNAIGFLESIVSGSEQRSLRLIRELHSLILRGIDDSNAGVWRRENVVISGASHLPPDALHVPEEMQRMEAEWLARVDANDPLTTAAWLHAEFVRIHPFVDGNGRTARLLMNLELLSAGYPPAIIQREERLEYYQSLDVFALHKNIEPFLLILYQAVIRSLKFMLKVIQTKPHP